MGWSSKMASTTTSTGDGGPGEQYHGRMMIEERSAQLALEPMMLAERDREYLKQLRRNRDCERDLMADVEGWEVGTYFGQPLYKTLGDDEIQQHMLRRSFYIHSSPWHATSEMGYSQYMTDQGGSGKWYEKYARLHGKVGDR